MRFLVQNKKTRMFLKTDGTWTKDAIKGKDFASSIEAVSYCLKEKVQDVFIVLAFEDEGLNLRLDPFAVLRVGPGTGATRAY